MEWTRTLILHQERKKVCLCPHFLTNTRKWGLMQLFFYFSSYEIAILACSTIHYSQYYLHVVFIFPMFYFSLSFFGWAVMSSWDGCSLDGCSLDGWSLDACSLAGCSLNGCSLGGCFFDGYFLVFLLNLNKSKNLVVILLPLNKSKKLTAKLPWEKPDAYTFFV